MRMEKEGPAWRTKLKYMRQRYGEGGWLEKGPGSHGACDMWQKHAPLHLDVAQSDVCGHPSRQADACRCRYL